MRDIPVDGPVIPLTIDEVKKVEFSPETKSLTISAVQGNEFYSVPVQIHLDFSALATQQLLEAMNTLQRDWGKLVEVSSSKYSVQ